jgi:hypothetical protein
MKNLILILSAAFLGSCTAVESVDDAVRSVPLVGDVYGLGSDVVGGVYNVGKDAVEGAVDMVTPDEEVAAEDEE